MTKEADRNYQTLCPEHGWGVKVDDDECCVECGCVAFGCGVDEAAAEIERLRARQLTPEVLALVRRFLVWREEPAATKWAPGYVEGLLRGMTYLADALPAWVLEAAKDSNPTPRADSGGSGTETNS